MAVHNFREKDLTPFFLNRKGNVEKKAGKNILVTRLCDFAKYLYVKVDMRLEQFNLEWPVAREESCVRRPRLQDAYSLQAK